MCVVGGVGAGRVEIVANIIHPLPSVSLKGWETFTGQVKKPLGSLPYTSGTRRSRNIRVQVTYKNVVGIILQGETALQ